MDSLTGATDRYVKQAARDTVTQNAESDSAMVRYARVTDGNACDFCTMLASRGFVYRNKNRALYKKGIYDRYHSFCNCQVVVGFDVAQEKYISNGATVTRGWAQDTKLAAKGHDGSSELREVDIDELFERYQEMGNKFSPTKSKIFTGNNHLADQTASPFNSVGEMQNYLASSTSLDDLRDRCAVVEKWWNHRSYSDKYWKQLSRMVGELKQQFAA